MSPASYQTAPPRVVVPSRHGPGREARERAGNGTRTRDPNLGKVVLYQLSYSRVPPKSNRPVGLFLPIGGPLDHPPDRSGGEGERERTTLKSHHPFKSDSRLLLEKQKKERRYQ